MTITDDDLLRWEAEASAATPGPWFLAYSAVHADPLAAEYHRIERTIPVDAPDEAYGALPDTAVAFVPVVGGDTPTVQGWKDGTFVAAARTAVPDLCAEVRRLSAEYVALSDAATGQAQEIERLRCDSDAARRHRDAERDEEDARRRGLEAEINALRIEASELRASLADAVGKIEVMRLSEEDKSSLVRLTADLDVARADCYSRMSSAEMGRDHAEWERQRARLARIEKDMHVLDRLAEAP